MTDTPAALAIDSRGNLIVTCCAFNGTDYDWATLKYDGQSSATLWGPVLMDRGPDSADIPWAIVPDRNDDVPPGSFAADWIEDPFNRAIPPIYCPGKPNTRGQMAVFLVETFFAPWVEAGGPVDGPAA